LLLALGTLGLGEGEGEPPWPFGRPPTPAEVDALIAAETELADLERFEEFIEASEKGEDSEHIRVPQESIDEGYYDLEKLFTFGDATFAHEFRRENGYGDSLLPRLRRVHDGHKGGLDTFSCAGCHQQGGVNGAGAVTANTFYFGDGDKASSAVVRNPPNVLGLGIVQQLGHEMSGYLQGQRSAAAAKAKASGMPVTIELETHGVRFGKLVARPDGSFDISQIDGVDADLVIKPFGWKGHTARLRRFAERAARIHFGVQSHVLATQYQQKPDPDLGPGPNWWDPDNDGITRELEEGTLTAISVYMEQLEVPVLLPPHDPELRERWAKGAAFFRSIGCTGCHKETLTLVSDIWYERSDTTEGEPVKVVLLEDGEQPRGTGEVRLFSDLKRHRMGPALADPNDDPDGIPRDVFITRPLWGVGETAPYLHDGRAATIPEAIKEHGGEAQPARDLYLGANERDRHDLHVFLLSLSRMPRLRVPQ
jgi:cytochrome c peroxidase